MQGKHISSQNVSALRSGGASSGSIASGGHPRRLPKLHGQRPAAGQQSGPGMPRQPQVSTPPSVRIDNVLNKALSLQSMTAPGSPAPDIGVRSAEAPLPRLPPPNTATSGPPGGAGRSTGSSTSAHDSKAVSHVEVPIASPAFDASIGATRVDDDPSFSLHDDPLGPATTRPPVQLIEGGQWKYFLFFVLKAVLITGTIAMVVVNCDQGPPDEERQRTPSQDLSVAGQTCQINPLIDGWWVTLVGMGAAQFLWAAGAAVYYAFTGWFPRNSSEVYLLQLPVSTISLVSAGAGLAGGGYLLLMLSWFVVSLMSGFAVVAGLLTGVPGLFDKPEDKKAEAVADAKGTIGRKPTGSAVRINSTSSADSSSSPKARQVQPQASAEEGVFVGVNPRQAAPSSNDSDSDDDVGDSIYTDTRHARGARILSAQADAAGERDEVDNPYAVTVQQYGRWYTALLLLYEFNKISDIATALILGVGDPLRVAFFVLGTLSLAHVQVTFYWLVGTRDGDTTVIDLYRGVGDVVLDTPMLCIEFYAIVTGVITEANFTVFVISLVLKSLSTLSHIFTLYKDIKLFMESRSRENFRRIGSKLKNSLTATKSMRRLGAGSSRQLKPKGPEPSDTQSASGNAYGTAPKDGASSSLALYKASSAQGLKPRKGGTTGGTGGGGSLALPSEPVALSPRATGVVRAPG